MKDQRVPGSALAEPAVRRIAFVGKALMLLWMFSTPLLCMSGDADITEQGRLVVEKDRGALLQTREKLIPLTGDKRSTSETLQDSRLSGRELRAVGQFRKDGTFEVHDFFVIRDGLAYRVIYYCEVCNITTFSPGNCMCCQAPTSPVEVLPTDPRIYHEEIKGPPKPHE